MVNISASRDFKMKEYFEVMEIIKQYAAENANIIVGNVIDEGMANSIRVTMVATGLTNQSLMDDNKASDVMKSFVYENDENQKEEQEDEAVNEQDDDDALNVFADNSENELDAMKVQADDEYDIPSFLRKK